MKKIIILIFLCISNFVYSTPNADRLFAIADKINQLDNKMQFKVAVKTNNRDYLFDVFISNENSIVKYLKPSKDKGKKILAKGMDMWIFIPSGKRPIRISPQQRLIGSVSNIDVARISLGVDYYASEVFSSSHNKKKAWLLRLKSKNKKSLYAQADLLIEVGTYKPKSAIFYTQSGKASKKIIFSGYKNIKGKQIATTRTIIDLLTGNKSTLTYLKFKKSKISDEYFQINSFAFF